MEVETTYSLRNLPQKGHEREEHILCAGCNKYVPTETLIAFTSERDDNQQEKPYLCPNCGYEGETTDAMTWACAGPCHRTFVSTEAGSPHSEGCGEACCFECIRKCNGKCPHCKERFDEVQLEMTIEFNNNGAVLTPLQATIAEKLADSIMLDILAIAANTERQNTDYMAQGLARATSFSELHEYCDANQLGDTEEIHGKLTDGIPDDEEREGKLDGALSVINHAQTLVDKWLKDGRPMRDSLVRPATDAGRSVISLLMAIAVLMLVAFSFAIALAPAQANTIDPIDLPPFVEFRIDEPCELGKPCPKICTVDANGVMNDIIACFNDE